MEQQQNQQQTQVQLPESKKKASKGKKLWLVFGIVAVVSMLVGGVILFTRQANSTIWAKVGNYEITKSTYNVLFKELPNRVNDQPNYNATEDTERTLVLNAGLKTEADKKGITFDAQDIEKYLDESYKSTAFKSAAGYTAFLRDQHKWSDETISIFTQNEFLSSKLRSELLAERSVVSTTIRWDTLKLPSAAGIPESSIVDTMNNKFLPLYKANKPAEEIARAADVNSFNSYEVNNAARENNPFTYSQFTSMDNLTQSGLSESFQNYEGLTKDIDEIDRLDKVGDFTQPFKSASGYYAIYRLEKLSGGVYKSWDDLVKKYKPNSVSKIFSYTEPTQEELGKTANSLSSFFIGNANAQTTAGTGGTCLGGHAIGFDFSFATQIVAAPNYTKVAGGSVSINGIRNNALCNYNTMPNPFYFNSTRFDYSGITSPWPGVNLTSSRTINSTNPNSGDVIYFDCNGPSPTITINPPPGYEYVQTLLYLGGGIPIVTTYSSFNLSSVRYNSSSPPVDYYSGIANGRNYAVAVQVRQITPPTYDGTIEIAKYKTGDGLGSFPVSPNAINGATVGLDHTPPDSWSPTKTSNPGKFNNIWVNPGNHESNSNGNYRAYVTVPNGWKVVRATNRGSNTALHGSCGSGGKCSVYNVTVDNNGTTYVDFFFEPDIAGTLDGICPTNDPRGGTYSQNGKLWGWVRDTYNNGGSSKVDVYIDGGPGNAAWGARLDANKVREPAVGGNYGFETDVPGQFFDGNAHTLTVFVLRNNGGFDGGNGNNPYQLAGSPRSFTCPPPNGVARCVTEGDKQFIQGWAVDPRKPQGPSLVHFYFDSTPGNTSDPDAVYNRNDVFGSIPLTPAEIISRKNEGYRGIVDDGKYRFKVVIPDGLHDGEDHELHIYQITVSTTNPELKYVLPTGPSIKFGPNIKCGDGGNPVDKWFWPWLQTQNGDVIASGKVTGQVSEAGLPGSRNPGQADKEAEYLVISVAGSGGPFCSTNSYILTNTSATSGNCGNGNGYDVLNKYALGDSSSQPDNDNIYQAATKAFADNGAGNSTNNANLKCSPYNTYNNLFNPIDMGTGSSGQAVCLNGSIFKASGSVSNLSVTSGRATIVSDSELYILGNITYDNIPGGYRQPDAIKKVPNLAIVVKGDVKIGKDVTRIDAAIYATGKVYTCNSNGNPGQTSPPEQCQERLLVNGMLVGKNGFLFGRSFHNDARNPAESIVLTGQTLAFPPPGLDSRYFSEFDNSVKIDSGEFQPRF